MTKPEPSILEQLDDIDPKADALRLAAAEADIAAGRLVPNDEVVKWLETWGKLDEAPAPKSWLK